MTKATLTSDSLEPSAVFSAWQQQLNTAPQILVALSGGLDSTVLLQLLVATVSPGRLCAVHVNHGLSANADQWQAQAEGCCRSLGVQLHCETVEVTPAGEGIEAAARHARAHDFILQLPAGYDTVIGDRGVRLSGGQQQRLALARALLKNPPILILDEATSSVDALTEVRISRALDVLASTRTTIAIAHRLSTAARADRVLVLADGVLVEDGHHDDLVQQGGTYAGLFDAWVSATSVGDAESVQSST